MDKDINKAKRFTYNPGGGYKKQLVIHIIFYVNFRGLGHLCPFRAVSFQVYIKSSFRGQAFYQKKLKNIKKTDKSLRENDKWRNGKGQPVGKRFREEMRQYMGFGEC
jgi:hypothetical protein